MNLLAQHLILLHRSLAIIKGIPVSTGGGDNMMGAPEPEMRMSGKLTMSLGTSGTLYAYSNKPIIDPKGWYRGIL